MKREMILRHLKVAERHLAQSEDQVRRRRQILRQAESRGWDMSLQRRALELFQQMRMLHGQHVQRLQDQLRAIGDVARAAEPEDESSGQL
jgi:hypothetical protein